jgi:hypothetical protein
MSNTTIALRSSGATGNVPNALSLAYGEFALNYADGIIYYRTDSDTVGSILTTQPSGLDKEIQFNDLGSFGSSANLSFNKTTGLLSTSGIYVSANAQIVGNVTANKLISNNSIGDSGGELLLAMPAANTILDGLGITIDAFQNKIRFYEQGGTNRGAYIDLTEAAANVGTNLLNAGSGNNALQYRSSYTANSGQTVFDATYIPGYVDTFINGVKLTPDVDFTATNGTTITLSDAAVANDSVEIIGYVTVSTTLPDAIQHRFSYTANAAQTTFPAIYVAPYIDVYKNGGRLSFGDDFIANNGTDIVLTTGAALDDLIEIVGYSSYTVTEVTADQLTTGRTIGMTGDVTWTSNSFNGTANVTGTSTLANTGVTEGTYTKVTVDAKGRVTTGNTLSSSDIPTLNQDTTGNAATATTANNVSGGTANVTTLTTSSTVTLSGGAVSGVAYLNASKVLTTGSALTFDGSNLTATTSALYPNITIASSGNNAIFGFKINNTGTGGVDWRVEQGRSAVGDFNISAPSVTGSPLYAINAASTAHYWSTTSGEQMRLTSTGLGIGTSSPTLKLDVNGSAKFAGSYVSFNDNGYIRTDAANILRFQPGSGGYQFRNSVNNANLAVLDSSGNLGLGVTPSAWDAGRRVFQVGGSGAVWASSSGVGTLFSSNNAYFDGSNFRYLATANATYYAQSTTGIHAWHTAPSGTAGNAITFTTAMTLDASGNLALGTTSPAAATRLTLDYPGFVQMVMRASGTARISLYGDAAVSAVDAQANPLAFNAGGAERARIDSAGNVGIGTSSPSAKLHITATAGVYNATVANVGDIGGGVIIRGASSGASSRIGLFLQGSDAIGAAIASAREDPGTTWKTYLSFYTNNLTGGNVQDLQEKMRINSNGAVVLQGGDISASGVGIAFPATQSASSNANTLDDYEEGSWTPSLSGAGSPTYFENYGRYIKIGRLVTLVGKIGVTGATASSNAVNVTGLPFTAQDATDTAQRACSFISGDVQSMGPYVASAALRTDSNSLTGVRDNGSGSTVFWLYSELSSTSFEFNINLTYLATA